jgi:hypothetical protein
MSQFSDSTQPALDYNSTIIGALELSEKTRCVDPAASSAASSMPSMRGRTRVQNGRPSSVRRSDRVVRSSSRTPTRVSSRWTARPTPEGVNPRASAARVIEPASTAAISTVGIVTSTVFTGLYLPLGTSRFQKNQWVSEPVEDGKRAFTCSM